jgi:sigma-B regulation protein RsbU (phosphoserine phosphatase)
VRSSVRAAQQDREQPGQVLRLANASLFDEMSRTGRFATAMLLSLPPGESAPVYASAGHTTGLWLRSHPLSIERLPSTTFPLGVGEEIEDVTIPVSLQPGDVVVMYSDGLTEVENASGQVLGVAGISDVLLATHAAPAGFILDSLVEVGLQHRGAAQTGTDDLTVVVIKRTAGGAPRPGFLLRLYEPCDLSVLADIENRLELLRAHLPEKPGTDRWLMRLQLAVAEAVTNVITHSCQPQPGIIHGLVALYPDCVIIDLFDTGKAFSMNSRGSQPYDPYHPPEGGYGLQIIRQVMDEIVYQRLPGSINHWRLMSRLPA